jgi:4-hydroxybenzoate polyprenyltransferase
MMRWLQFILSHSIFIAFCAVALCWQTVVLLQLSHRFWLYLFVFFSTLSSYNFYWLLSKYSFSYYSSFYTFIQKNRSYVFLFFVAALGMAIAFWHISYLFSYVVIAVLLTLIYSFPLWPFAFAKQLRQWGVLKTGLLAFTWAYVTTVLPAIGDPDAKINGIILLFSARFFFMLMLCSIFDQRDIRVDKMNGLSSLATDVSPASMKLIMFFCFIGYMLAGFVIRYSFGTNLQMAAFALTAGIVWWVYKLSLKKQGYWFYYFVVDGLMLLSALLTLMASLWGGNSF